MIAGFGEYSYGEAMKNMEDTVDERTTQQQEQIQEAVAQAVREAMREFVASMPADQAGNAGATGVQEQVDKIYAEMEGQIEKQKELLEAINNISDSNARFMEDVQARMDQQAETSLRLAEVQQMGGAPASMDLVAIKDSVSEFKLSVEQCSQTMDQLRKQLNRERNNNDRTITELYRSMKYSEERIEELHGNYDEFTTIIQSHKGIMGILVWLNIIVIAALVALSLIQMLG